MAGSQVGCVETRFTGDEKPAPGSLRFDLTKNASERIVTAKMRLSVIVTLCGVACGLAPTKVSRCVEDDKLWPILKSSKKEPA